jgi:CcmD family protein
VTWKRTGQWIALALFLVCAPAAGAASRDAQQPTQKPAQDEFVPVDQLPPGDKLPAARYLIAAYSVAWLLVAGYLFSIWQRLGRVEQEIADVNRRVQTSVAAAKASGGDRGAR